MGALAGGGGLGTACQKLFQIDLILDLRFQLHRGSNLLPDVIELIGVQVEGSIIVADLLFLILLSTISSGPVAFYLLQWSKALS